MDYGTTEIGVVGLTAGAFGLEDSVEADFGSVSLLESSFTSEIVTSLDQAKLRFAPSLVCTVVDGESGSSDCGAGVLVGVDQTIGDDIGRWGFEIDYQSVGSRESIGATAFLDVRF